MAAVRRIVRRIPPDPPLSHVRMSFQSSMMDGDSTHCPVCDRYAKIYSRKLTIGMARGLVAVYRSFEEEDEDGWLYTPPLLAEYEVPRTNDLALLRHWGFLEQRPGERSDGSNRTGWWRITQEGAEFVEGLIEARRNVVLDWKGDFLRLEGKWIMISDALGEPFDFRELLAPTKGNP